jgi:5-methylcytosine-specific restriction protein A
MRLREALRRVLTEYQEATTEPFGGHQLAQFIRRDLPITMREAAPKHASLVFEGSPGAGNWADGPWAAIFDPLITESAQEGYYPVYLFASDLSVVALSMNQGVTTLKNEIGTKAAREVLRSRAAIIGARLEKELRVRFSSDAIELNAPKSGSNLELYEAGHAFGVTYAANSLPDEDSLTTDLSAILDLYALLRNRGGVDELEVDADATSGSNKAEKLEDARQRLLHERIERNRKLAERAKELHGFICQVCGFNFERFYGSLGREFIIAHHKTPLAKLATSGPVALSPESDFAVVCANCHAMIHASGAPESFEEFVRQFRLQRA